MTTSEKIIAWASLIVVAAMWLVLCGCATRPSVTVDLPPMIYEQP
jgi:hypothetical protein